MARISTITTGTPASTSKLIGNIGSTTYSWNIEDMPGVMPSTAGTTNQILKTTNGVPTWVDTTAVLADVLTTGEIIYGSSDGGAAALADPTSGALLQYSTVDGSLGPAWLGMTSGSIIVGSSLGGIPRVLAVGTDGQVLESSNSSVHWAAQTSGLISTVGTSGQLLQTTGAAATWIGITSGNLLYGNSSGEVTELATAGDGTYLSLVAGVPTWSADPSTGHITTAGTSGQILQTTGGAAAWVGLTSGNLFYGNSSGEITELATATDGTYLSLAAGVPTWAADPSTGHITTVSATSGHILQSTGGAAAWVGLTANTLFVGNSSGQIVELAAGTSGQKLVAKPEPGWIDDDWGLSIVIDGNGSTITATTKGAVRIPYAVGLEGWELIADTTGDITIDLYVEDPSSTPASSNSKITSTEVPSLTDAQRSSGTCSSWTTLITAGDWITFDVTAGSSDITQAYLSIWGKKLSTV